MSMIEMRKSGESARDINIGSGSSARGFIPTNWNNAPDVGSDHTDLLKFYDSYVYELKTKAGDDDHAPIPGNLYSYRALRRFGETSGLFQIKATPVLQLGLIMVCVVQLVAPIVIIMWCVEQVFFFKDGKLFSWESRYVDTAKERNFSQLNQQILGTIFLLLFSLNGAYVLKTDEENLRKILDMCELFRLVAERSQQKGGRTSLLTAGSAETTQPVIGDRQSSASELSDLKNKVIASPHKFWLWLGAALNTWCLLTCSIALLLCFVFSESPKDVIFDALGLTFLYNLDDVGGDLGLLDEQWDEDLLGDVYGGLADCEASDDGDNIVQNIQNARRMQWTPNDIISFGYYVMMLFVVLLPIAFAGLNLQPKNPEGRRLSSDAVTIAELQAQLDDLSAVVAKMVAPAA
jgi:hypothetical protein